MKNKSLEYVLKYYRHGAMNVEAAYRKTLSAGAVPCACPKKMSQPIYKIGRTLFVGRHKSQPLHWAIAAAVIVLLTVSAVLLFRPSVTTLVAVGSNKVFTLDDGTVVTLAPHSTLSYKDDCREVEITGKAYLNIHHDAEHPFTIKDDEYTIKDIGTRLMVTTANWPAQDRPLQKDESATIYVEEGSVLLKANNDDASSITLKQAQGATVSGDGKIRRIAKVSQNMTAWATHEFHFDNTSLSDVLQDLSEYYNVKLTISSADGHKARTLQDKRLTADFQADSLQTIIEMIEETMNVTIKTK